MFWNVCSINLVVGSFRRGRGVCASLSRTGPVLRYLSIISYGQRIPVSWRLNMSRSPSRCRGIKRYNNGCWSDEFHFGHFPQLRKRAQQSKSLCLSLLWIQNVGWLWSPLWNFTYIYFLKVTDGFQRGRGCYNIEFHSPIPLLAVWDE